MSVVSATSPTPAWSEFSHEICALLNCNQCVVLVGDADLVRQTTPLVDRACQHPSVTDAFTKRTSGCGAASRCCAPADMPHVTFTTETNQQIAQKCMAVFGRIPFLAIVDMRDDDDEHSFLFDLNSDVTTVANAAALTEEMVSFLTRVGRGTEPRCRQGAPPPLKDVFEPTHGAVLCEARAAVTATFTRLLGKTPATSSGISVAPCGGLCVFWSDRCPCCPGVLMLVEAMVKLIRLVAARHAEHPSGNVSFVFPFLAANIDDNEFTEEEWPVAQREQVVPALVAYPAPNYEPVLFTGERLPLRLAQFICAHCLPSAELVACTPHIMEEVGRVAAQLSIDALMTVVDESSEAFIAAKAAYETFVTSDTNTAAPPAAAPTTDSLEQLLTSLSEIRAAVLPFSLEAEVRRMSAEGGAAAAGSLSDSVPADDDGGDETDADDDMAETKGSGSGGAGVAMAAAPGTASSTPPTTALPALSMTDVYKRPREW